MTALFAPAPVREGLFALLAFNLELARIPDSVSQPMLGAIRFQWWREAIADLYEGSVRRHPVLESLAPWTALLPAERLQTLIDARATDLEEEPPRDLAELAALAHETGGIVTELSAGLLLSAPEPAAPLREICHAVGAAWALVGSVRALPHRARRGRLLLPADLMAGQGIAPRAVAEGRAGEGVRRIARQVIGAAEQELAAARAVRHRAGAALPALLPAALADFYIAAIKRVDYDPFRLPVRPPAPRLQLRLLRKAALGRF